MDQVLTRQEPLKKRRRDMAFLEVWIVEDAAVERDGGLDTFDDEFVEAIRSEKFDMAYHVLGGHDIMKQHEGPKHMRDGRLLRRIDNAFMGMPCCVEPKKISILRYDYSSVSGGPLQMFHILSCLQAEFLNCNDIHAAPAQPLGHRFRDMLVQIELDPVSHRSFHSASMWFGFAIRPHKTHPSE